MDADLRRWMLGEGAPKDSAARRIEVLERDGLRATSLWPGWFHDSVDGQGQNRLAGDAGPH